MGQQHQLYVIAQVGSRYRVLAALHRHLSLTEPVYESAITHSIVVLEHFRRERNLAGLRRELQKAETLDWAEEILGYEKDKPRADESTFPFIATCFLISSTLGHYCGTTCLMPINLAFDNPCIPNNDGISVFDISELGRPRFGFFFPGQNVLMDGETYLTYVGRYREWKSSSRSLPEDDFGTVSLHALRDTWPGREFGVAFARVRPEISGDLGLEETRMWRRSLKGRSIAMLADAAFDESQESLSWIEQAALVREFAPALLRRFHSKPQLVTGRNELLLLGLAAREEKTVDLSPFRLRPEEALRVVRVAGGVQKHRNRRMLILPCIEDLTASDLKAMLRDFAPAGLAIGDTPGISLQQLLDLVAGSSVVEFTCSALYKRSLELIGPRSHLLPNLSATSFPSFTSSGFPITQMVYLQHTKYHNASLSFSLGNSSIACTNNHNDSQLSPIGNSNPKGPTLPPPPATYPCSSPILPLCLPLRDSLLSPNYASSLLTRSLPFLLYSIPRSPLSPSTYSCHELLGREICALVERFAVFGGLRSTLPIPAETYETWRRFSFVKQEPLPRFSELERGEWTILVMVAVDAEEPLPVEADKVQCVRYAFLTRGVKDGKLEVQDAKGFFEATVANAELRLELESDWVESCDELKRGFWSSSWGGKIRLQAIEEAEAKDVVEYLTAFNEKVDEYEVENRQLLRESREARLEKREKGGLVTRL